MTCPLCLAATQDLILETAEYRVVWADDTPDHPLFVRVIWQTHVVEMTSLALAARTRLMAAVWQVEQALLALPLALRPDKINLASLGNQVPHLHWHVIARYRDDAQFPAPIWALAQRPSNPTRLALRHQARAEFTRLFKAVSSQIGA